MSNFCLLTNVGIFELMFNMKRLFSIAVVLFLLSGCNSDKGKRWRIPANELPTEKIILKDYGKALFSLDTTQFAAELLRCQNEFPQFLNGDLCDSANINPLLRFVTDPFLRYLSDRVLQVFADKTRLENSIAQIFNRLHYYEPDFEFPEVFTYVSGLQLDAPVMANGKTLIIGLDCYLGPDEPFYQQAGIPVYRLMRMDAAHLPSDIAQTLYHVYFEKETQSVNLLDEMIQAGKRYVFVEALCPETAPHILLGYSETQYEWLKKYEGQVWRSIIGEQLLYSNDPVLFRKFFGDGPFTKEFSTEAPARIGEYIGWQIMRNYMSSHKDITLNQMITLSDSQQLLSASRYKPK